MMKLRGSKDVLRQTQIESKEMSKAQKHHKKRYETFSAENTTKTQNAHMQAASQATQKVLLPIVSRLCASAHPNPSPAVISTFNNVIRSPLNYSFTQNVSVHASYVPTAARIGKNAKIDLIVLTKVIDKLNTLQCKEATQQNPQDMIGVI